MLKERVEKMELAQEDEYEIRQQVMRMPLPSRYSQWGHRKTTMLASPIISGIDGILTDLDNDLETSLRRFAANDPRLGETTREGYSRPPRASRELHFHSQLSLSSRIWVDSAIAEDDADSKARQAMHEDELTGSVEVVNAKAALVNARQS